MTVQDFPRGGKKTELKKSSNSLLYKQNKARAPKARSKKIENEVITVEKPFVPKVAPCLTLSSLMEGMIVLGRVSTSTEYGISVSLPGRLKGQISVTDISQKYTNILQNLVEGEDHPPEFKSLNELYKHGDFIVCYVKLINAEEKDPIKLSIEPELVNQNLIPEKLQKGSKIVGTISSIEDHGYVIDTGMEILRGFLPNSDTDDNVKYYPGQQILCSVKKLKLDENITTVKLSTKSKHVTSAVTFHDDQFLDAITPGTSIILDIKAILSNGLQVTFNQNKIGYINQLYLNKPLKTYEQGENIIGKLLYVLPTMKIAYFSEILTEKDTESVETGEIIEKAKFLYRESNGVMLHLKKGVRGFVSFKQTGIDFNEISSKFITNSIHKCRVMYYHLFDGVYICTMQSHLLKNKFVTLKNIKFGELMTLKVMRIDKTSGFVFVQSNRVRGDVPPQHAYDVPNSGEQLQIGTIVKAKVFKKNKQGNGILFTLKKSLIESTLPVLSDINDATVGSIHHCTVLSVNKFGMLVEFFNGVKGWVSIKEPTKKSDTTRSAVIGEVVLVKIDKIIKEEEKIFLSLVNTSPEVNKNVEYDIGKTVEGIVVESSIDGIYLKITDNNESNSVIGFLPAGHMAPCREIATHLSLRYIPGDKLSALVFSTSPDFLLTRTFAPQKNCTSFKKLQIGDCIPCSVKEISKTDLKVILPIKNIEDYNVVPLSKIDDIENLFIHQILFGKITNINKKEKKINVSTTLVDVWRSAVQLDTDKMGAVDQLLLYLSKLKELSSLPYYKNKNISSVTLGARVTGVVDKVTEHGLVLKLDNDTTGTVRPAHCKKTFKVGDKIEGTVIWINYIHELVEVTLLPTLMNCISDKQTKLPETSLKVQLRGEVLLITDWFVLVVLKGQGKGRLVVLPSRRHVNDLKPNLSTYAVRKKVRCYVILNKNESELLPICLLKSAFEAKKKVVSEEIEKLKRKSDNFENDGLLINKLKKSVKIVEKEIKLEKNNNTKKTNVKRKFEVLQKDGIKEEDNEDEIENEIPVKKAKGIIENLAILDCGFSWNTKPDTEILTKEESSSESDEDDNGQQKQKKKKKLSAAERRELERQKEREIRQREEALASNQIPNSVDQFDKLVLASPDSSIIWLQYMAYHLQATEIDKARAVAKRALKTISFREENEKLNVWQAWLNMESRFGTPTSLNDVFQQAINANNSKDIYLHMLTVHAEANRHAELEKMIKIVIGKFKQIPEIWIHIGTVLLKIGLKDKSKHIMQRALQSLPPKEHVGLMVKFAQSENKFGDRERAKTLFEQILSSYPKRVDVWSSYVDSLIKYEDIDAARQVLDKAVIQILPPRKMRVLFKKFISFEEQYGTPEGVEHARELALAYVEKQCNNEVN